MPTACLSQALGTRASAMGCVKRGGRVFFRWWWCFAYRLGLRLGKELRLVHKGPEGKEMFSVFARTYFLKLSTSQ